jgi:fermentation-respiration switch protein FrsA (DUF1100 family)
LHGTRDEVIPFSHGQTLAAASAKAKLISWDAGHNDLPHDPDRYANQIFTFLRESEIVP